MDGDQRATFGVKATNKAFVRIVSCNITNFAAHGVYGTDNAAVWVTNSSIFGNRWFGVGVFDLAGLFLRGSTIYDNGIYGIYAQKSKVYVEQSTISKHSEYAIVGDSTGDSSVDVIVSHSTIVSESNRTKKPLVLALDGASISLDNSILVNPSNAAWGISGEGGEVIDGGFNAIQASEYPQSISNTTIVSDNLLLGNLEDNGGPTLTHALLEGSLAIDAGSCTPSFSDHWFFVDRVVFDQRGVARPQGSGCDIGAYEFEVEVAAVVIEASGNGKKCINGNSQKQPITMRNQVDCSTFDATKVVYDSIVIPGYKVFQARVHKGHLSLLIEKDRDTQNQTVVAGTTIDVTGDMDDGTMFAGTLSICP